MKKVIVLGAVIAGFLYTGCKTGDTPSPELNPPVITLLNQDPGFVSDTICGELQERVMKVATGDTILLKLHLKGDNILSQYKLEAHENFDCHDLEERPLAGPWEIHRVYDLSSKDTLVTVYLAMPSGAE